HARAGCARARDAQHAGRRPAGSGARLRSRAERRRNPMGRAPDPAAQRGRPLPEAARPARDARAAAHHRDPRGARRAHHDHAPARYAASAPATHPHGAMMFDKDPLTALEALSEAQRLAFAPLAFQATSVMRERGVLAALADAVPEGLPAAEVVARTGLSAYAVRVLLEAGLGLRILWRRDGRYHLGKLGRFLLED